MAEDEMVEIVPNMRMEPLNMLCVCSSLCSCCYIVASVDLCRWVTFIMVYREILVHSTHKWLPKYLCGLQLQR